MALSHAGQGGGYPLETLKIIDIHTHIWRARGYRQDEDALLQAVERYHITRIHVSALGGYQPAPEVVKELNEAVSRFHRAHPDCVSGYVYISPENPDAMEVLRHGIEDQEMDGVKFWVSAPCDDPCVYPLVERMIGYGVPLLIHAFKKANGQVPNESIGENVARLARRYPEAKIIMAHLGGNCYDGVPAIRDVPNVWCDWCGSIFRGDELAYALEYLGPDRLLYGTDMPGSFLVNLGQLLELDLSDADRDKILYGNAEKLFDRSFRPEGGKRV